jgi:alkaline phosphatase D
MSIDTSRRQFIRDVALGTVAVGGGLGLAGCGGSDDGPSEAGADAGAGIEFKHGVASGDPLSDRVILWTRATPSADATLQLGWELASDSQFTSIVKSGTVATSAAKDYTAQVDVTGLAASTVYHYRFSIGSKRSATGRTKTLPVGSVSQVRLAVFSCSNYPAGYFNVYAEAARRQSIGNDVDAALHLGDYIYEYDSKGYATDDAAALGRVPDPANETLTLADYRRRYAQYRTDADLQALHAAMPMIAVWDDHEVANDTWTGGAENHDPATEGSFSARRAAAIQAWLEWIPIRLPDASKPDQIYRSFDFGTLLSLHMLDTRQVGRDQQLSYANYITASGFDAAGFTSAVGNPARQLMGATQTTWLQSKLQASAATWQVLGQQVLMGRMNVPAPIVTQQTSVAGYGAIATKAATAPGTLTPTEQAILAQPAIPYNLDAWDGYAAARETVLGMARALDKNLVSLAGDTHNAWASDLKDLSGNAVGVEFATSSVTSPGFETIFTTEEPTAFAAALTQLIGPLQYAQTSLRGYMVLNVTPTEARADWVFVDTILKRDYVASTGRSLRMLPGSANRKLVEV